MKSEQQRLPRFAVLIDADNTSPQIAEGLFEEVAKFGEASVRRIYGDFSNQQLRSWSEILQKHAIDPYQQFAYTKGKNAADIALVIDAMDLLHSGRFDGFCLVSSDSDFTRLASRLREQGADVYGFGAQKTPESFRQACRRFIYTENLVPQAATAKTDTASKPNPLRPPSSAIPILKKAMSQIESEDGWVTLGAVGKQVAFTLVERNGRARSFHVANVTGKTLRPIIVQNVSRKSALMTDDAGQYRPIGKEFARHEAVNHGIEEYVRGDAHSNTVEGFFSILKRGVIGTYHHVSEAHLHRYLAEADFK